MKSYDSVGCLLLLCFALAASALAEEERGVDWITGKQLLSDCERGDDFCLGYIMGATASFLGHGSSFCLPTGVSGNQVKDLVNIWLKEHPELLQKTASYLVFQALKERLPCN
jgi:Rap1a immunity proteins